MSNTKLTDNELNNVTGGIDLVYRGEKVPANNLVMDHSVSPQPSMLVHTPKNNTQNLDDKLVSGGHSSNIMTC